MMTIALLDESFVSEILLAFLRENGIPVFAEKELAKKVTERGIRTLSANETKAMLSSGKCAVYSNSEKFVPLISENYANSDSTRALRVFKNKALFRKTLSDIFPTLYFKEIPVKDAHSFKPPEGRKLILKPTVGFWSVGIRRFSDRKGYEKSVKEALAEIKDTRSLFDSSIIGDSSFLVEENLEGQEFACDAYFDKDGKPVILGLYCHHFRDKEDVRDLVYYTGKRVVENALEKTEKFLISLSERVRVANFPIHFEFIINHEKDLVPVEINPMRFGGFGLADLTFHCFGINPYEFYFFEKKPDWGRVLASTSGDYHGFVLGRAEGLKSPDTEKFKQSFRKLNGFISMDHRKSPVFCIAYAQSSDLNEIVKYVHFDFSEYEA